MHHYQRGKIGARINRLLSLLFHVLTAKQQQTEGRCFSPAATDCSTYAAYIQMNEKSLRGNERQMSALFSRVDVNK